MIIEGRAIHNIAELKEFCDAAIAVAKVDPSKITFAGALKLRLHQDDRRATYNIEGWW